MRVVFRTEGNHQQGMGDIWGSIALADEFAKHSVETLFLLAEGEEAVSLIVERGYKVCTVPSRAHEDEALKAFGPDVIILNKLKNPPEHVKSLREFASLIVTIDDAGQGARHANLNINAMYYIDGAVVDTRFVGLRREFQEAHGWEKPISNEVRELLITQGGGDTGGFTPVIVRALERVRCRPHCTVVTGPAFQHHAEFQQSLNASTLDLTHVHNAQNMCQLAWEADLAITAGGLTMFELACVGTPSIVVCGEPFEVEPGIRLDKAGAVVSLGFGGGVDYAKLPDLVDDLSNGVEVRRRMSARGKESVDGRGCERTVGLIRERLEQARLPGV